MFTGIIETTGNITSISRSSDSVQISIESGFISSGCRPGDSVSVNGVCLTVTGISGSTTEFDAVSETLSMTTVPKWKQGTAVNLERAVTPQSRLGGHIVQGHIDGTAALKRIAENRTGIDLWFTGDDSYIRYIVNKGSICIDGVSLTVAELSGMDFRVSLVPFTLNETTLKDRKPGDLVNIETDIIGRYVERLIGYSAESGKLTLGKLLESGFSRRK